MNQSVHVVNLVSSMITLVFFGDSKELGSNKLKNLVHTCVSSDKTSIRFRTLMYKVIQFSSVFNTAVTSVLFALIL